MNSHCSQRNVSAGRKPPTPVPGGHRGLAHPRVLSGAHLGEAQLRGGRRPARGPAEAIMTGADSDRTEPGGHPGISDTRGWERNENPVWLFEPPQSGKQGDGAFSVD